MIDYMCVAEGGVYLHLPFCRAKCNYCDFVSYTGRETELPAYWQALRCELKRSLPAGFRVNSVYLGGGTPSLGEPMEVAETLAVLRARAPLSEAAEITLEANPGTVDQKRLRAFRAAGVNRISLGVQSFDDSALRLLGRIHDADTVRRTVLESRQAGFDNVSLDLIYAVPGITSVGWKMVLCAALALRPQHLSLYALNCEEGTPLMEAVARGELRLADQEESAEQFELAHSLLTAAGYWHYEISNYALGDGQRDWRCRHNLGCWLGEPYYGFGVAAHSFAAGRRWWNHATLEEYLAAVADSKSPQASSEALDGLTQARERLMLGLRLSEGVDLAALEERYQVDAIGALADAVNGMQRQGLLQREGTRLVATQGGWLLCSELLLQLLPLLKLRTGDAAAIPPSG